MRGAQLRAIEREPRFGVVWLEADCLRVFGNGGVVFLAPFEVAAPAAAPRRQRSRRPGGPAATSEEEAALSAVRNR